MHYCFVVALLTFKGLAFVLVLPGGASSKDCVPTDSCEGHYKCHGFKKSCYYGYKGKDCRDRDLNEKRDPYCPSRGPCKNGGTCWKNTCCCVQGYYGVLCENDVNECSSSPCQHRGSCIDHIGGYTCICQLDSPGINCEGDLITSPYPLDWVDESESPQEAPEEPQEPPDEVPEEPQEPPEEVPEEPQEPPEEVPEEPQQPPDEVPEEPQEPPDEVPEEPEATHGPTTSGSFQCPGLFGQFQDPDDCSKFFHCVWKKPHAKQCKKGTFFDPALQVCNWSWSVNKKYLANCRRP